MKITPMMQQYLDAKEAHPDALMLFRLGDFYEAFLDDAVTIAEELDLTLTARGKDTDSPIPMCGVPHHAVEGYIRRLLEKGYSVARCDQLEDASKVKGLVRRGVTSIFTPGMRLDGESLEAKENNFTVAVALSSLRDADTYAIAALDLSTGEFHITEAMSQDGLSSEIRRLRPAEILVTEDNAPLVQGQLNDLEQRVVIQPNEHANIQRVLQGETGSLLNVPIDGTTIEIRNQDEVKTMVGALDAYTIRDRRAVDMAVSALLHRVIDTQGGIPRHLDPPRVQRAEDYLELDEFSMANLEIFETLMGGRKKGTLFDTIDRTLTAAGGRRLRTWLTYPLQSIDAIMERQSRVSAMVSQPAVRDKLRELLRKTSDMQRISSKLVGGKGNARDLNILRDTILQMPALSAVAHDFRHEAISDAADALTVCVDIGERIEATIADEPPIALNEGDLIRKGFNAELDKLIKLSTEGKQWLLDYEAQERERTGISSLKVRHNRVFGFFIEVTRANLDAVPDNYIRKQTLANSERYFTIELKEYEENILSADERRKEQEYEIFCALRDEVIAALGRIREVAWQIAEFDAVSALAELAHEGAYVAPTIQEEVGILIEEGRHPVVEAMLKEERFVPNDITLNSDAHLLLITGPNMAGKSTVIRQVALITLMAQIGSFVPAQRAVIGVVDQIFSRVGASDNLARGQSTFMVEMSEVARILQRATSRSLIILDEIGRGTATWDGLSIAWSVTEYLHDDIEALTLFATHYHELTELSRTRPGVRNYNIAVREWDEQIIFLRRLLEGPANRSYGIQVARLAGVPDAVVQRAKTILHNLEQTELDADQQPAIAREYTQSGEPIVKKMDQMSLFAATEAKESEPVTEHPVLSELRQLDVTHTMPLDALILLDRWKKELAKSEN